MKHLISLKEYEKKDVENIFRIADEILEGKYRDFLKNKTVVMFFPESSIRTRVTFEKGIYLLGGQSILFPPAALDKKEELKDVTGYLNNWADAVIVRHKEMGLLEEMGRHAECPVINAMTDRNHPCEILADLYALSKIRKNYLEDKYLFVGARGNIGLAWKEASEVMELELTQSCPAGYEMEGVMFVEELQKAVQGKDIICTDSRSPEELNAFRSHQVTVEIMEMANQNALLNPCPPFYRGEEVSDTVADSRYFAGYSFKKHLLEIQQAVIIYCMA